jgi:hypothetical protein
MSIKRISAHLPSFSLLHPVFIFASMLELCAFRIKETKLFLEEGTGCIGIGEVLNTFVEQHEKQTTCKHTFVALTQALPRLMNLLF